MPSINKVISPMGAALKDSQTANFAEADAELVHTLHGRNRALYELIKGSSADATSAPAIPKNPSGLTGIDHSGPPWGICMRHPLYYFSSFRDTTNLVHQRTPIIGQSLNSEELFFEVRFRVRPFPSTVSGTPYGKGFLFWTIENTSGAGSTVVTADILDVRDEVILTTSSITETVATGATTSYEETSDPITLRQGFNYFRIKMTSASYDVRLHEFSINQIKKVSH